jgi:hypothetical protein
LARGSAFLVLLELRFHRLFLLLHLLFGLFLAFNFRQFGTVGSGPAADATQQHGGQAKKAKKSPHELTPFVENVIRNPHRSSDDNTAKAPLYPGNRKISRKIFRRTRFFLIFCPQRGKIGFEGLKSEEADALGILRRRYTRNFRDVVFEACGFALLAAFYLNVRRFAFSVSCLIGMF